MKLSDYVDGAHGRQTEIAAAIERQPQLVWQWARGVRRVPSDLCPGFERATGGAVTCEELRPDEPWRRIPDKAWPNPKGRPVLDFAALAPVREAA